MDLLIPFHGRDIQNLRYALRSIAQNLSGYSDIFIIGDEPKGIKNINFLPYPNSARNRNANIFFKALASPVERFVYWFDDHVLLKPLHVSAIIPHYCGTIPEIIPKKNAVYRNDLERTLKTLTDLGKPALCYDSHTPCILEKSNLIKLTRLDWSRRFAYVLKTLYFNMFGPEGSYLPTCKLQMPYTVSELRDKNLTWVSTPDNVHRGLIQFLAETFPNECKFG